MEASTAVPEPEAHANAHALRMVGGVGVRLSNRPPYRVKAVSEGAPAHKSGAVHVVRQMCVGCQVPGLGVHDAIKSIPE